jgi:hypothetical protein
MNFDIGKTSLNINPLYKFLLYQIVKRNLYSHIACEGNSSSTYNIKKKLHANPLFNILSKKIENKIKEVVVGRDLIAHSMWVNISNIGGKIGRHNHYTVGEENKISGAYYLNKPKDSGNIIFHTTEKTLVEVKTNDLIFFDSKLYHETEENKSNKDRIVCGFNFLVK